MKIDKYLAKREKEAEKFWKKSSLNPNRHKKQTKTEEKLLTYKKENQ